jgi:uncharacterized protein YndB with AHSA1/START domain
MIGYLLSIGGVLVMAVGALLIFASMKPDIFRVQRSTTIAAPPERIFPFIEDLHAFNLWNPYAQKDPNQKGTYAGPDKGPGASFAWESSKQGSGRMEILETSAPTKVAIKLVFIKPFAATNAAEFNIESRGANSVVTWSMNGPTPFVAKIFHVFVNVEKMVGRDFENGLANLKALAEAA